MDNKAHEKLNEWLLQSGTSVTELADELIVNRATVYRWLSGDKTPNPIFRAGIEKITNGAVMKDDWLRTVIEVKGKVS